MKGLIYRAAQRLRMANYWLIAQAAMATLFVLRRLPMEAALDFADRTARRLGPLFGRHRVALDNLRQAYPEKSDEEIRAIALDMWGNMARLAAEYIFLEQLFDYYPGRPDQGRIEVRGVEIYERIAAEKKAAHHLHRPSRQFRDDPDRRRGIRAACDGDVPAAQQPLHRRLHPLDAPRGDGKPAAVTGRRLDRTGQGSRRGRQYRRSGRPEVPSRRGNHVLRPPLRDQPAGAQARPAVRMRRLPGALQAPAGQTLSGSSSRKSSICRAAPTAGSTSRPARSC